MVQESASRSNNSSNGQKKIVYALYFGVIFLLVVTIISIFTGMGKSPAATDSTETIPSTPIEPDTSTSTEVSEAKPMKDVEPLGDVVSSCNSFIAQSDSSSYCQTFRKVDFDGLQVFVNCDYSDVKAQLDSQGFSCLGQTTTAQVCEKNNLNETEFVAVDNKVNSCSETFG